MIIIPVNEEDIKDPSVFIENLKKNARVHLKSLQVDEERGLVADFEVDGKPYQAEINPTDVEIPEFVRPQHAFTKEEIERIDGTKTGLSVCMDYEGDSRVCFYDQLRFINAMFSFPGILAVMDCPSEKLLSGKWVALAANSSIMPAPRYLLQYRQFLMRTVKCGFTLTDLRDAVCMSLRSYARIRINAMTIIK
jgi:hypothetical protein